MDNNYAKVKNDKWASDDDAGDLLAGILSETEDDAIAEQQRLEAELQAKRDQERNAKASAEEARQREAAAKLSEEMNRLEGVKQKRTEKLQAIQVEELKERGEWIDPEIERQRLESIRQQEVDAAAIQQQAAMQATSMAKAGQVVAKPAKSKMPLIALGVFALLLIVSGVGATLFLGGYSADETVYSKAVFVPKQAETNLVEKGFTKVRKKRIAVSPTQKDSKRSSKRSKRSKRRDRVASSSSRKKKKSSRKISSKPKKNKASKSAKKLADALNQDIFGKGM